MVLHEMSIIIEPNNPMISNVFEPSQKYTMVFSKDDNAIHQDMSYDDIIRSMRNQSRDSVDLESSFNLRRHKRV